MDLNAANADAGEPTLSAAEVADLLDTLEAADVRATIADLEDLLAILRPAAAVRERLAAADSATVKAALMMRATRRQRSGGAVPW